MAIKRIIPVSSGKGGVGKTTFAVNFSLALSQFGRTVLVDLDTGTSSIRNAIDVPIPRDLYHFFKKGESLNRCVTPLDHRIDPTGKYPNFGFVAGPLHLIEEITNFGPQRKTQLIDAINSLDADYVILDMKAGLDSNVIDFLPFSNPGILVFTPHLPAATFAAADIVKSLLFRKLRLIFSKESPFFATVGDRIDFWKLTNELIDQVEDVYDDSIENLDAFAVDLSESLGDHPITKVVYSAINFFRVHYVLNLFNGVEDSFNTAVRPFLENLTDNVSSRPTVTNLGWVSKSDSIDKANRNRIPALLVGEEKQPRKQDRISKELDDLRLTVGLEPIRKPKVLPVRPEKPPRVEDHLTQQLDTLKTMFELKKNDDYRANFDYIVQRTLFTLKTRRSSELGDSRIFKPSEILDLIFSKSSAASG